MSDNLNSTKKDVAIMKLLETCRKNLFYLLALVVGFMLIFFNLTRGLSSYKEVREMRKQYQKKIDSVDLKITSKKLSTQKLSAEHKLLLDEYEKQKKQISKKLKKMKEHHSFVSRMIRRCKFKKDLGYIYNSNNTTHLLEFLGNCHNVWGRMAKLKFKFKTGVVSSFVNSIKHKNVYDFYTKNNRSLRYSRFTPGYLMQVLLLHLSLFKIKDELSARIRKENLKVEAALNTSGNNYSEKIRKKEILLKGYNRELDDLKARKENLKLNRNESNDNLRKKKEQLTQSFQLSGVSISSPALIPLMPFVMIVFFLAFQIHLARLLHVFSQQNKESNGCEVRIEFNWFFFYRDRISLFASYLVAILPSLLSLFMIVYSVLYIEKTLNILGIDIGYSPVNGIKLIFLLVLSAILIFLSWQVLRTRHKIMNLSKISINELSE